MQRAKSIEKSSTKNINKETCLNGWVSRIRKLGKIMFFNLQYAGKQMQVIVKDKGLIEQTSSHVRNGDLIAVKGWYQTKEICPREETIRIPTELLMTSWEMINKTITLPFEIKDDLGIKEDNRYRYRYLDFRRTKSREVLIYKHKLLTHIRNFFHQENFIEIETPILSQNSPEGAKTFTVPSKIAGYSYTLPQSPQIFKQILMIGDFDKYYQIAKSFRNEDARSNRQPEFLQLDLEMSFVDEEEIFALTEGLMKSILSEVFSVAEELVSFQKIEFDDCIGKYGTDKPDLRNPLTITSIEKGSDFPIFLNTPGETSYKEFGMYIPPSIYCRELVEFIRKEISGPNKYSLARITEGKHELVSGISMTNSDQNYQRFSDGIYLIVNGEQNTVREGLLKIRKFCDKFFLRENHKEFKFLWVTK